jgi:hypothetical protein
MVVPLQQRSHCAQDPLASIWGALPCALLLKSSLTAEALQLVQCSLALNSGTRNARASSTKELA